MGSRTTESDTAPTGPCLFTTGQCSPRRFRSRKIYVTEARLILGNKGLRAPGRDVDVVSTARAPSAWEDESLRDWAIEPVRPVHTRDMDPVGWECPP